MNEKYTYTEKIVTFCMWVYIFIYFIVIFGTYLCIYFLYVQIRIKCLFLFGWMYFHRFTFLAHGFVCVVLDLTIPCSVSVRLHSMVLFTPSVSLSLPETLTAHSLINFLWNFWLILSFSDRRSTVSMCVCVLLFFLLCKIPKIVCVILRAGSCLWCIYIVSFSGSCNLSSMLRYFGFSNNCSAPALFTGYFLYTFFVCLSSLCSLFTVIKENTYINYKELSLIMTPRWKAYVEKKPMRNSISFCLVHLQCDRSFAWL